MEEEKLHPAYVAGFFDGEGCVWLSSAVTKKNYILRASIDQASSDILQKIQKQYGGKITEWKSKVNGKRVTKWSTTNGLQTINFLNELYPYLQVKKIQCEFANIFWNLPWRDKSGTRGGRRIHVTNEEREIDEMLAYSIKIAKPRHWDDYTDIKSDSELVDFIFDKVCENYN